MGICFVCDVSGYYIAMNFNDALGVTMPDMTQPTAAMYCLSKFVTSAECAANTVNFLSLHNTEVFRTYYGEAGGEMAVS